MRGCPTPEQLRRFLLEELSGSETAALEAHVQGCPSCQQALETLTEPDFARRPTLPDPLHFLLRTQVEPPAEPGAAPPSISGYEVLEELGRGGMGVVYKAWQTAAGRVVALKVSREGATEEELARFRREAEAAARLQHPNVVPVFEVGEWCRAGDGRPLPFFSAEWCAGGSLKDRLDRGPLPAWEAAGLVELLARAVHHAHTRGVVHRDLKPENILLTEDGTPKVADFGLARKLETPGPTVSGAVMGTPGYMAPEQAAGKGKEAGPAADVYALGATLYACLTGRPPFLADGLPELFFQMLHVEPVPVRRLRPATPRDLETICLKCLEKEPRKRYASAEALADDLRRFRGQEPIRARPPGTLYRLGKFVGRHRVLVAVVTAAFVALAAAVVGLSLGLQEANRQRERAEGADRDKAALLAESLFQLARFHEQRGEWEEALGFLNQALDAHHPDPVGLRIERVKCHVALGREADANEEVQGLLAGPPLGDRQAVVWLWQADLLVGRDNDAAIELVGRAVSAGTLSPADRAYAAGLAAEDVGDAADQFRQAVREEPTHLRANQMLVLMLLLLGRKAEARQRLETARAFFRHDLYLQIDDAFLCALEDDSEGRKRAEGALRDQLGARNSDFLALTLDILQEGQGSEDWGEGEINWRLAKWTGRLAWLAASPEAEPTPAVDLRLLHPPTVSRAFGSWLQASREGLFGVLNADRLRESLPEVAAHYPEGTVTFVWGLSLLDAGRWEEARAALTRALELRSLVPVRRRTLAALAAAEWNLAGREAEPAKSAAGRDAVRRLRDLIAAGGPPPDSAGLMAEIAAQAGDFDAARYLLDQGRAMTPDDPELGLLRVSVELQAGAPAAAAREARALLDKDPTNERARDLLGRAVKALGNGPESLTDPPPDSPR